MSSALPFILSVHLLHLTIGINLTQAQGCSVLLPCNVRNPKPNILKSSERQLASTSKRQSKRPKHVSQFSEAAQGSEAVLIL